MNIAEPGLVQRRRDPRIGIVVLAPGSATSSFSVSGGSLTSWAA